MRKIEIKDPWNSTKRNEDRLTEKKPLLKPSENQVVFAVSYFIAAFFHIFIPCFKTVMVFVS